MTSVKRKEKLNIQINFDPFLLFIWVSVLVHGLGILVFVLADRSRQDTSQETEVTPIDFIVVPPETVIEEPPPETERRAINNSIAKGEVNPDLPSATNKIGNEAITPSNLPETPVVNSVARETPTKVQSPPQPQPQTVTPSPSLPPRQQPSTTPPPSQPAKPSPSLSETRSTATVSPEEVKPTPTVTKKPKPIARTPLTSEFNPRPIPLPQLEPLPEKEPETVTPQPETSAVATQPKPLTPSPEEILPQEPEKPTVAKTLPDRSPSIETTESNSAPTTPTPPPEQQTPVGSGSASLLGGTYSKNLAEDGGSSFFQPEANASQQALNSSGLDARQDLNMGPYFAEIRRRVRRNWQPSNPDRDRHTVLAFTIQRNGQITGLRVRQSSGSPKADEESLKAVQKAAPFATLPANYPHEQLDIVFSFNLYLHQGILTPQLENWQRF